MEYFKILSPLQNLKIASKDITSYDCARIIISAYKLLKNNGDTI